MSHFDLAHDVIWWKSEEIFIPYRSPVDGKIHRYFPDFLINTKNKNKQGLNETTLIEVKPFSQTIEPKKKKDNTRKYINEMFTWGINSSKWEAAEAYCKDRGWKFFVMTEKDIYGEDYVKGNFR